MGTKAARKPAMRNMASRLRLTTAAMPPLEGAMNEGISNASGATNRVALVSLIIVAGSVNARNNTSHWSLRRPRRYIANATAAAQQRKIDRLDEMFMVP